MWGVVVACTAGAKDFKSLITTRFFLGIFEATVGALNQHYASRLESSTTYSSPFLHHHHPNGQVLIPRLSSYHQLILAFQWWRRREQTLRLCLWFTMNGVTGMVCSTFP